MGQQNKSTVNWEQVKHTINQARDIQIKRQHKLNSLLEGNELQKVCQLNEKEEKDILKMLEQLHVSARASHKILKLARTIADLEQSPVICRRHVTEAVSYRQFDKLMKD
jgi:magnesium chelatase family protein